MKCQICGKQTEIEPKYCCNGKDCGCMGQPVNEDVKCAECKDNILEVTVSMTIDVREFKEQRGYLANEVASNGHDEMYGIESVYDCIADALYSKYGNDILK